jgi:hypothetical protein
MGTCRRPLEIPMNLHISPPPAADAILWADDPDATIAAWSLDELDRLTDLESLRAARTPTDDRGG